VFSFVLCSLLDTADYDVVRLLLLLMITRLLATCTGNSVVSSND